MGDCVNAEIRDSLPDLLHGRLEPEVRARVESHVATCAECAAELALLRRAAAVIAVAPRVDAQRVTAVLPRPGALKRPRPISTRMLRLAAAVLVAVFVGGVLKTVIEPRESVQVADRRPIASQRPPAELTLVGGMDALSTDDLAVLVGAVESLASTPSGEPDPLLLPVAVPEEDA